jgi:predicted secreted Zn-dependent protease
MWKDLSWGPSIKVDALVDSPLQASAQRSGPFKALLRKGSKAHGQRNAKVQDRVDEKGQEDLFRLGQYLRGRGQILRQEERLERGMGSVLARATGHLVPAGKECEPITDVTLKVGYTITMPSWSKADSLGKNRRAAWDKMMTALAKHEENHRVILLEQATLVARTLDLAPSPRRERTNSLGRLRNFGLGL